MRILTHPALDDITVEGLLYALSDPVRVRIYAEIVARDVPQPCCALMELTGKALPKSTLSQHFKVLREAGLIRSERKGVELHNTSRCDELKPKFGVMIEAIMTAFATQQTSKE